MVASFVFDAIVDSWVSTVWELEGDDDNVWEEGEKEGVKEFVDDVVKRLCNKASESSAGAVDDAAVVIVVVIIGFVIDFVAKGEGRNSERADWVAA